MSALVERALERARRDWRAILGAAHPLSAGMPVLVRTDPGAAASFEAYTDLTTIHLLLNRPAELEAELRGIAVPHYRDAAAALYGAGPLPDDELADHLGRDLFLLVLFHEVYHPLCGPSSVDDQKAMARALYQAFAEREPSLSPRDVLLRVDRCKNLLWDVVVNLTLLARSQGVRASVLAERIAARFRQEGRTAGGVPVSSLPAALLPILYLLSSVRGTTDALLAVMGLFYTSLSVADPALRERTSRVFLADLERRGTGEAAARRTLAEVLRGLVGEPPGGALARHGLDRRELEGLAGVVAAGRGRAYERSRRTLVEAVDVLFDASELRYPALKGCMKALVPLVEPPAALASEAGKQGSQDARTSGWGEDAGPEASEAERAAESLAGTLDDLSETLGETCVETVLRELAGSGDSPEAMQAIRDFARDQLYKRTAEPVEILAPAPGLVQVELGRQQRWRLTRSQDLTAAELASLDLPWIVQTQSASGLPILLQQTSDRYKLNEFALEESPIAGWSTVEAVAWLPRSWILLLDSSGSMSGAPYDLLLRAVYGIQRGIFEVCTAGGLDLAFGVVNFSSKTLFSGLAGFVETYRARTHPAKRVLFTEQGGSTELDPAVFARIAAELPPGPAVYTLVTDGQITNEAAVQAEVETIVSGGGAVFLFVEIGAGSALGRKLEALRKPNLLYRRIAAAGEVRESLKTLLLRFSPAASRVPRSTRAARPAGRRARR